MRKKKKLSFKRNITKFNYWEDWSLYDIKTKKEVFRIPIKNEKEIEAEIRRLLIEIRQKGKIEEIPNLLKKDYDTMNFVKDDIPSNLGGINSESKDIEILTALLKALKSDKSGRTLPENLSAIIKKDLNEFREMAIRYSKGEKYDDFTSVKQGYPDSGLKRIWTEYKKVSDFMMEKIGYSDKNPEHWVDIFNILTFMSCCIKQRNFIIPLFIIGMDNFVLIQGTGISDDEIEELGIE